MIRKQEGGTERGRLLLPGERRDWAARNLIPLPPSRLFMAALSRRRAPSLRLRGEGLPGDRRGAAGAEIRPNTEGSFAYRPRPSALIGPTSALRHCFSKEDDK